MATVHGVLLVSSVHRTLAVTAKLLARLSASLAASAAPPLLPTFAVNPGGTSSSAIAAACVKREIAHGRRMFDSRQGLSQCCPMQQGCSGAANGGETIAAQLEWVYQAYVTVWADPTRCHRHAQRRAAQQH